MEGRHLRKAAMRRVNQMSIRVYKPTTNGRRNMSVTDYSGLSRLLPREAFLLLSPRTPDATATAESPFAIAAAETAESIV